MSISFYVKNKKKFLGYETVLNVESALTLLNKELNVYNNKNIDINDLLLSPVSNYECLLIGEDKVSARGFENLCCKSLYSFFKRRLAFSFRIYKSIG